MNDRHTEFRVAVRAREGGRYMYQIFALCGEPRTFRSDSESYATPAEAERAGYRAVAVLNRALGLASYPKRPASC